MKNKYLERRYNKTLAFVKKHAESNCKILDLGTENAFSHILKNEGYRVENTREKIWILIILPIQILMQI